MILLYLEIVPCLNMMHRSRFIEKEEVNTETLIEAVKECEDAALSVKGLQTLKALGFFF